MSTSPAQPTKGNRTVQLAPLSIRAAVDSINDGDRTVEVVFSTGAPVERFDWNSGKRYLETLSLDPAHIRVDRLNAGAPVLDSHSAWSVSDQLGAVVPGSVRLLKNEGRATVRFSKRDAVEPIWQDVRDGIIRSVSIGYKVYRFEETEGKGNALPVRSAVDWEPFEVSMVPIPADAGAKVRDGKSDDAYSCEIVPAGSKPPAPPAKPAATTPKEEKTMDENRSEAFVADLELKPAPAPAPPKEPTDIERATAGERERISGIVAACRGRMDGAFLQKMIDERVPLVDVQARVLRELELRDKGDTPAANSRPHIVVGEDPAVHVREGIVDALLHRAHPHHQVTERGITKDVGFKATDKGRAYQGLSLLRIAERMLLAKGINVARMSEVEIAGVALGLRFDGMHSTSDFPLLLADVANKTLRAGYEEAPQTFAPFTRRTTVPDFKQVKRTQIGEAPALELVNEHGEIKSGTIDEGREVYAISTYGKKFAITRKAIINDDLDAFSRVPANMGRQARNLESDLVWAQITANGDMGDSQPLFSAAHGNIDAAGGAISIDTIGAARAAMRLQTGLDGTTILNVIPRYLLVPAALETLADQFVSQALAPSQASNVNPFAGRISVIAEPRLDADSADHWYMSAAIGEFPDIVELANLAGQQGPMLERMLGFDVDGVSFKVLFDVGAKVIDWRGLYKNVGET